MDQHFFGDFLGRDGVGQSWRLAAMEAEDKYIIQNYDGSIFDVLVTVNSINGKEASITISTTDPNGIFKIKKKKTTTCDKLKNKSSKHKKKCKHNAVLNILSWRLQYQAYNARIKRSLN